MFSKATESRRGSRQLIVMFDHAHCWLTEHRLPCLQSLPYSLTSGKNQHDLRKEDHQRNHDNVCN